jgi:cytidylate kinase
MNISYYPFIDKALSLFNLRERMMNADAKNSSSFVTPFITIAREPGSGGAPIAKAVAQKIGFEFIDEQIIDDIAKSTKKRREIIKQIDEKSRTGIEDIIHSALNTEYVDDLKYVRELFKVILAYAHQGKTVILGRGANFITPFAKGLHVNITAPHKIRVQRAIDFEGHSESKAKAVIAKTERERKDFVKQYLKKDINDVGAYDLVINTSYFRMAEASDLVIEALYRKFPVSLKYGSLKPKK